MTAEAFAGLLNGRRIGVDRWQAKCPAHEDGSPSLSIREGRDGRVLLNCFAGCRLTSILNAMGLQIRDVFAGPPPSAEQRAKLTAVQDAELLRKHAARQKERKLEDRARKLEAVRDALGAKLARAESDEVSRLFHSACDKHRATVTELDLLYQRREPARTGSRRIA